VAGSCEKVKNLQILNMIANPSLVKQLLALASKER
jgi:hypothetical protein